MPVVRILLRAKVVTPPRIRLRILWTLCLLFRAFLAPAHAGVFRAQDFAPTSSWNTRIGTTARVAVDLLAKLDVGLDSWGAGGAWSVPCYRAMLTDATHRLLYNPDAWRNVAGGRWRRWGNDTATEIAIRASSRSVFPSGGNPFSSISAGAWRAPSFAAAARGLADAFFRLNADMRPAAGADGHMAVLQPDGRVLETYATIVLRNGDVVALSASVTDPGGMGDGRARGQTASMIPDYAGLLTDAEVISGIEHAIAVTVPASLLAPRIAYPAAAFDRDALTNPEPYAGTLPMGARLALPAKFDLTALRLQTAAGRTIAAAAASYGFIVVDRGGEGVTLRVQPNGERKVVALHAWDGALHADLRAIFAHLEQVPVATAAP